MGERKGTNKYYPPDFNPEKHGSLNRYHNSHPLRERARKLSQGILIIRFEMPYNIWCDGCKNHIGMGVRYNAEKKKVGNYYTTPIYRFRMKCHLCVNYIEMQTDPANCDYVIVSGAQRKEERWDMEDNEQVLTTEHEKKQKLETDAMFRLEHGEADRSTLKKALPTLSHIQEAQSAWKDDFALNSMLRKRFREKKKAMQEEEERDQALQAKASLTIPLVPETEDDRKLAALLKFHTLDSYEDKQKLKRTEIISRSWFSSTPGPRAGSSKAGSVLKKLAQNRRCAPVGSPITVEDLGIVRRRSREALESLRLAAETPKPGEPWVPEGNTQDRPASPPDCSPETAETPRSRGPPGQAGKRPDRPRSPPGPSQEAAASRDTPHPGTLSSSLVADYSDSESE
ncbi:probable splicing factor YJU2B isoform X2 [Neofelis nebulosa]|uniref:probable splicing factor YJU2B isoform X2 n=1 Tax=Neofelis nebulosa TaxID=61452 RepID=UPI00272B710D|nr:probable splicing factor YJU2B isoform X2 [Neofelis nebulosa]XP_058583786.1 probable splicing factor YJU2B isoform X2 [Neofelis nebulosa]XP_058583787.1 probable splicing factor YJU2B isoform X2 [Neofelis nebulosa]XP_058583788.1 probable splicing factor YJU2B isoform X2 [Neofelis nebulosa]XP_058583789.1 probable splicing factor YJU2B isoform X2 [Neofelis nebulosa]